MPSVSGPHREKANAVMSKTVRTLMFIVNLKQEIPKWRYKKGQPYKIPFSIYSEKKEYLYPYISLMA
jgi:hypothetical protein